jgi:hypothetical protein
VFEVERLHLTQEPFAATAPSAVGSQQQIPNLAHNGRGDDQPFVLGCGCGQVTHHVGDRVSLAFQLIVSCRWGALLIHLVQCCLQAPSRSVAVGQDDR